MTCSPGNMRWMQDTGKSNLAAFLLPVENYVFALLHAPQSAHRRKTVQTLDSSLASGSTLQADRCKGWLDLHLTFAGYKSRSQANRLRRGVRIESQPISNAARPEV
jgi:hypothetical protein